jgi:hypothetical protein
MKYVKVIEFTCNKNDVSENVLWFESYDDGVDYFKTLTKLENIAQPFILLLNETYYSKYDGILLLLYYRLSYFFLREMALMPVYINIQTDISKLIGFDPKFIVLFTSGVCINKEINNSSGVINDPLDKEQYERVIESIPYVIESTHDLANEWGPIRLQYGYGLLKGQLNKTNYIDNNKKYTFRLFYWYLLSKAELQKDSQKFDNAETAGTIKTWRKFLSSYLDDPLNILVIDDDLNKGWQSAISELFNEVPQSSNLTFIGKNNNQDFDVDEAKILVTQKEWDLVILDYRLTRKDRSEGAVYDIHKIANSSSSEIIQVLKKFNSSIPVLLFTSSNKVWTFDYFYEQFGVKYHWIKENPVHGNFDDYTKQNTKDLLRIIQLLVCNKRNFSFLWDFIVSLRKSIDNEKYYKNYDELVKIDTKKFEGYIKERLQAILELAIRSYGHIDDEPKDYYYKTYMRDPLAMSFLYLWGCLNECFHLRCGTRENNKKYFIIKNGSVFHCDDNEVRRKLNIQKESIELKEILLLGYLIKREYGEECYNKLSSMRKKRNYLTVIHGSTESGDRIKDIEYNDLTDMVKLLRWLLFL